MLEFEACYVKDAGGHGGAFLLKDRILAIPTSIELDRISSIREWAKVEDVDFGQIPSFIPLEFTGGNFVLL